MNGLSGSVSIFENLCHMSCRPELILSRVIFKIQPHITAITFVPCGLPLETDLEIEVLPVTVSIMFFVSAKRAASEKDA